MKILELIDLLWQFKEYYECTKYTSSVSFVPPHICLSTYYRNPVSRTRFLHHVVVVVVRKRSVSKQSLWEKKIVWLEETGTHWACIGVCNNMPLPFVALPVKKEKNAFLCRQPSRNYNIIHILDRTQAVDCKSVCVSDCVVLCSSSSTS